MSTWVDVTSQFFSAAEEVGQTEFFAPMISSDNFSLQNSMNAIEVYIFFSFNIFYFVLM